MGRYIEIQNFTDVWFRIRHLYGIVKPKLPNVEIFDVHSVTISI